MLRVILQLSLLGMAVSSLAAAAAAAGGGGGGATATTRSRRLEDAGNDDLDVSQYALQSGTCFRMKIAENNDDDGNSYFYNGAYRAQYSAYIAFQLCRSGDCRQYVSDLNTYLDETVAFVQTLCDSCQQSCRRALRSLQDGGVDCSTCSSVCQRIQNANGGDETQYLDCQKSDQQSDDGMQYYTGPQCEDGSLRIGLFYDNECTIKASKSLSDFSYATFGAIQSSGLDCSLGDACSNLVGSASSCSSSAGDDDAKLCRAAANASRVVNYHKKSIWNKMPVTFIVTCALLLTVSCLFLSYTYYLRHQHHAEVNKKVPMSELDGEAPLPPLS